ncbi:MAG: TRAP transporter large permease subunit [Proteobacteria bacterium]|nr:TRAP transporter large permease subunit [Pseudomonadota bacterium]
MLVGGLMFLALFVLLLSGIPISGALGLVGLASLGIYDPVLLKGVPFVIWNTCTNFTLVAAPLFVLMGELLLVSGISTRFYRAVSIWVRWLPGGLLQTNIVASSIFAAVSGSSVATAATMGTIAIPEMEKRNYDMKIVYGSLAAGGTLGILIPPSIAMIIYCSMVYESVGKLFIAGIIPGALMALLFVGYIMVRSLAGKNVAPQEKGIHVSFGERVTSLIDLAPTLIIILFILLAIYLGWATPNEIAAIGVVLSIFFSLVYRGFTWRSFMKSLGYTAHVSSMLLFVIVGAQIFSYAMFTWGATAEISEAVGNLDMSPNAIWFLLAVMYIFLGMFIDAISMMVLTLAVVHPIIIKLGFDSVWFGVVLVLLLEVGLITPPVGLNLYTLQAVARNARFVDIVRGSFPFVILLLAGVIIFTIFPQIVLWLPRIMY